MACNYYYNINPGQPEIVDKTWVAINGGIDPNTSTPAELEAAGFYCWVPAIQPTYDPVLEEVSSTTTIVGTDAIQSYTVSDLPLASAKVNAVSYEKQQGTAQMAAMSSESGYSEGVLTATASKLEVDRDPSIQATLTAQNAYVDRMMTNVAAINAATSVSEISDIIYAPVGVLNTGRGGPGQAGPEDLNPSYLTSLSLAGYTAADLELYVPGTSTVIPYNPGLPSPYEFDSFGVCFAVGDYTMQVRVASTDMVLGTMVVPEGANTDVGFS